MYKMTSKERILNAMVGRETDMVPISPKLMVYLLNVYGSNSLETHMKFQQKYDYDIIYPIGSSLPNPVETAMSHLPYTKDVKVEAETWQENDLTVVRRVFHTPAGKLQDVTKIPPMKREYGVSPNSIKTEWLIKDRGDLERIAYIMPDPLKNCSTKRYFDTETELGDKGIVQMVIRGPLDKLAGEARGMENLMMDYYDDKEFFYDIINFFMERTMGETKAYMEAGIRNIFASWFYTSLSAGWSPAIFKEVFVPLMKKHVSLVHSYDGIYDLYDDGKCMQVIEYYGETGTDVLETLTPPPVGDVDLKRVKELIGDKVCLLGYIDLIYVMQLGKEDDVKNAIRDAISKAAPGGRFILSTSDSIREGTPLENIEAYFHAGRELGKYPIRI